MLIYNYTLSNFQFFKIGFAMLDMVYNLDNITQSCTNTAIEASYGIENYFLELDPDTAINNVIF